jgi:S-adenosylmethionine decarboxylase
MAPTSTNSLDDRPDAATKAAAVHGCEWIIDAHGCDAAALRDQGRLRALVDRLIETLALTPVAAPVWHTFPAPGGITGVVVLAESHVACHTFPEFGSICVNVFCCRPRPKLDLAALMTECLGATAINVRCVERVYGPWKSRGA